MKFIFIILISFLLLPRAYSDSLTQNLTCNEVSKNLIYLLDDLCTDGGDALQKILSSGTPEEVKNYLKTCTDPESGNSSVWITLMYPSSSVRMGAYLASIDFIQNEIRFNEMNAGNPNLFQILNLATAETFNRTLNGKPLIPPKRSRITEKESGIGKESQWIAELASNFLCHTSFGKVKGCGSALRHVIKWMSPTTVGETFVSLKPEMDELFSDPKNAAPLAKAAIKLDQIVKGTKTLEPDETIISLLKNSFKDYGFSEDDALNRAWLVMGIYGTRGASISPLIYSVHNAESEVIYLSLTLISTAISLVESESPFNHQKFALSRNINSHCDTGKEYRFWLPAYLTRKLVKNGHPKNAAKAATYLSALGYEYTSRTFGRDSLKNLPFEKGDDATFEKESLFIDSTFSLAGALYGSFDALDSESVIDIDETLSEMRSSLKKDPLKRKPFWPLKKLKSWEEQFDLISPIKKFL